MKVKFTETVEKDIDVQFPAYRKNKSWIVKVISEKEFISISTFGNPHYSHQQYNLFNTSEYFGGDYTEATREEFESLLTAVSRSIARDMEAEGLLPVVEVFPPTVERMEE